MPKKQCNIRMSDATRKKLDELTKKYGTQAEAVAVAIHNLWLQEFSERGIDWWGGGDIIMVQGE